MWCKHQIFSGLKLGFILYYRASTICLQSWYSPWYFSASLWKWMILWQTVMKFQLAQKTRLEDTVTQAIICCLIHLTLPICSHSLLIYTVSFCYFIAHYFQTPLTMGHRLLGVPGPHLGNQWSMNALQKCVSDIGDPLIHLARWIIIPVCRPPHCSLFNLHYNQTELQLSLIYQHSNTLLIITMHHCCEHANVQMLAFSFILFLFLFYGWFVRMHCKAEHC